MSYNIFLFFLWFYYHIYTLIISAIVFSGQIYSIFLIKPKKLFKYHRFENLKNETFLVIHREKP